MQQKTPDEFFGSDGHGFHFVSVSFNPYDDKYTGLFIADGKEVGDWQF